ncbi:hypothetical protein N2152v2_004554 [Parachlorella kessleri]
MFYLGEAGVTDRVVAKKARRKKKKASGDAQATTAGAEAAPAQQSAAATAGAAAAAAAWSESESEEEEEPDTAAAGVPRGAWVGASYADSLTAGAAGWESAARPRKKAAGSSQATAGTFPASRRPAVPGQRHHKGPVHECARPGCGAAGKKGFRKCRCGKVWYCTPACSASDWPRHQLECE